MKTPNAFPENADDINLTCYNQHADKFYERFAARYAEPRVGQLCDDFLSLLPPDAHILDIGCGPGLHTKYFLEKGYKVTAFDGAEEFVEMAKHYTNHPILLMKFNEMNFRPEEFDGIWAMASLLHVGRKELPLLLEKNILPALKSGGYLYMSFKEGEGETFSNERYFCDYTEEEMKKVLQGFPTLTLVKSWKNKDSLLASAEFSWINFIVRKEA